MMKVRADLSMLAAGPVRHLLLHVPPYCIIPISPPSPESAKGFAAPTSRPDTMEPAPTSVPTFERGTSNPGGSLQLTSNRHQACMEHRRAALLWDVANA